MGIGCEVQELAKTFSSGFANALRTPLREPTKNLKQVHNRNNFAVQIPRYNLRSHWAKRNDSRIHIEGLPMLFLQRKQCLTNAALPDVGLAVEFNLGDAW